jgi:spermidine/putrescine-binding protein
VQVARVRGAQAETPVKVVYVIPKEGATVWFDLIAIPADAPHPENAYAFIDYLMEPKDIGHFQPRGRSQRKRVPAVCLCGTEERSLGVSDKRGLQEAQGRQTLAA